MSQFNEAADAIRRISKHLEGFRIAAEALDRVGSVDNAAQEAQSARDAAVKQKVKADMELSDAIKSLDATRQEQKALVEATDAKGKEMIAAATEKAKLVADSILREAQDKAANLVSQANSESLRINSATATIAAGVVAAEEAKATLDAEIAAKEGQLSELNDALNKLKAKFQE